VVPAAVILAFVSVEESVAVDAALPPASVPAPPFPPVAVAVALVALPLVTSIATAFSPGLPGNPLVPVKTACPKHGRINATNPSNMKILSTPSIPPRFTLLRRDIVFIQGELMLGLVEG
jgi:hypothetical protein